MAEVPRELLKTLTEQINLLSGDAQDEARNAVESILSDWMRNGGGDIAALRDMTYEAMETVLTAYADTYAAASAATYYDAVRAEQKFPGRYTAVADSMRNPDATMGAVRYFVGKVAEGAPEAFVSLCVKRVDEEIRRSANKCVARNVMRDPAKPWYARVPSGGETCGFCLMLSSFGFYARTERAAEHSHANCDCRIVPGFDGVTTVKGYKPEDMYERYNLCLDTLGGRDGIRADWNALPKEEREALIKARGGKRSEAFDAYVSRRMAAEIETRDPDWFKSGKKLGFEKETGAKPLGKEKEVGKKLREKGISVKFMKEINETGVKTADAWLCGAAWEFKVPDGYVGEYTVRNQFKKARDKSTSKLLISCTENHAPAREVESIVKKLFDDGEYQYISEVLVMDSNGSLRRIKRSKK